MKLGKYDLSQKYERGSEIRYPQDVIVHPDWKFFDARYDADIAIIILDAKVQITNSVSPICLWNKRKERTKKRGIVVGWGKTDSSEEKLKPKQLDVYLRTDSDCLSKNPRFSAITSENTFCAGKDSESGPCSGDSGSGLFMRSNSKLWYLRGIVSSGFIEGGICGVSNDVVFTNVLKYSKWFDEVSDVLDVKMSSLPEDTTVRSRKKFDKEIFCFFESWAGGRSGDGAFSFDHLKPELCTTLVFLHADMDDDNLKSINPWQQTASNGEKLYKKFTDLKRTNPGLKTLLSVGSWNEGSVKYSQLAADPERRQRFARNSAEFLKEHHFDGLHFHWEYPGHRGGDSEDKENFVLLLKEIRDVYKPQNLYLSSFIRTQNAVVENAYDLKNIAKYVDAILMMTFDLTGPWDDKVGFHAPLRGNGEKNIESRVRYFMDQGVPADKIVLGIPFFGRTFVTENDGNVGDRTINNHGFAGPFFREDGFLGYNEICSMRRDKQWDISFDPESSQAIGKFKHNGLTNVATFDSPRSVANKVKFLMEKNLAGVWTWFVDSDDFRRRCEVDTTAFSDYQNVSVPIRKEQDFPLLRTVNDAMELLTPQKAADDGNSDSD